MAQPKYFRLADFSGGYNPNQHPLLLEDNEAADILNFSLAKPGSLISRHGYVKYHEQPLPANVVQLGAHRVPKDLSKSEVLVHLDDGTVRTLDRDGNTVTLGDSFGDTRGRFLSAQDYTIYANGERPPLLYDGTTAQPVGLPQPEAPVFDWRGPNSGALPEGDYEWVFTFYDSSTGAESMPSEPLQATAASGGEVIGFLLPRTGKPDTVDQLRLYRKDPNSQVFGLMQTMDWPASGDAAYSDFNNYPPNPSIIPPLDHTPPPNLETVEFYAGYYFGAVGRTLYWSKPSTQPGAVHYWPALNFTEVPFVGNDEIVALVSHQDALLIFGRQNLLLLTGVAGQWSITRLDTEIGMSGPDAYVEVGGQVLFLSGDGLRVFPGLAPVAPKLSRQLVHMGPITRERAILGYVPNGEELWVCIAGRTYTVYLPTQAVSIYDFNPTALLSGGADGESAPLLTTPGGGTVVEHGAVTTDDGEPIRLVWRSKIFQLPNPETTKFLRRFGAYASIGSEAAVQLFMPDTSVGYDAHISAAAAGDSLTWDNFDWDSGTWPSEGATYVVAPLPAHHLQGNSVQLLITAYSSERTEITPPLTILYREANRLLGR